jgi:hypothetical protein
MAGRTGSISRLWRGVQRQVVTGLASHAPAGRGGGGALGPHDVIPMSGGRLDVTIGLGTDPANRAACTIGKDFGWLVRAHTNGTWHNRIDLAAYEARANPDGGPHDSNPYGLLAPARTGRDDGGDDDGRGNASKNAVIATDAGGNSLLSIGPGNHVRTLATFPSRSSSPPRETDSVPTSVAHGPDGALYVGELTGVPFAVGAANVYRVSSRGVVTVFRSGFTAITDIAFGRDGSLYVLQFATGPFLSGPGALIRVAPGGSRSAVSTFPYDLVAPTSVVVGPDGAFYISNCGIAPQGGGPPECAPGNGGHVLRVKV